MKRTTLCYLEQDGRYLMLHRVKKQHDENHDKWIGVGEKFGRARKARRTACREVLEEHDLTKFRYCGGLRWICSDIWPDPTCTVPRHGFTGITEAVLNGERIR